MATTDVGERPSTSLEVESKKPVGVKDHRASRKEERWRDIYSSLDVNADGKIDMKELSEVLQKHMHEDHARSIVDRVFKKKSALATPVPDCTIDFKEFLEFMKENDAKRAIVFNEIDVNKDGVVDAFELRNYMQKLGITISMENANKIVEKMQSTGKSAVDLEAFQDYLMLNLSSDPLDIANFWQHSLIVDVGEDTMVPENFTLEQFKRSTWWRHLLSGFIAGAVSRSFTAPLDRLKIFMQVHASQSNKFGIVPGFKTLLKEGGFKSLWRGNGVNVMKIAPETALKFMLYEKFKTLIKGDQSNDLLIQQRFIAGSLSGASAQTLIYPMEVLKTRLALRKTGQLNKGIVDAARTVYRNEGMRAFYRGYGPNLLGIMPYAGIDLAVYETLKLLYIKHRKSAAGDPNVIIVLACGACSAICGQFVSFPFALVKTRLQAHVKKGDQPSTMIGQFRTIVRAEGMRGLYRGLAPGALKIVPAVSISYVIYEAVRKYLGATVTL